MPPEVHVTSKHRNDKKTNVDSICCGWRRHPLVGKAFIHEARQAADCNAERG